MKPIILSAALIVFFGVQAAADEFCDSLNAAVALSPSKFSSIRGKPVPDYGWDTSFKVAGMDNCDLQNQDSGEIDLYCSLKDGENYDKVKSDVQKCLPWKSEEYTRSGGRRSIYFFRMGKDAKVIQTIVRIWQTAQLRSVTLDISDVLE